MARSYVVACQCGDFGLAFQSLNGKFLRKNKATFKDGISNNPANGVMVPPIPQ